MKEEIKSLRVRIDGLSQLVKELKPTKEYKTFFTNDAETRTVFTHEKAILAQGKDLQGLLVKCNTKELIKCHNSLILGKAWLGKMLYELGDTSPYIHDGNRHSVADIEPAADRLDLTDGATKDCITSGEALQNCSKDFNLLNHIEKVDWLRQELKGIALVITGLTPSTQVSREYAIARTNSYNHICEAIFWLGFELQRIKEQEDGSNTSGN